MLLALSPAVAQDKPPCTMIDEIVAQVAEGGGVLLALLDVPGKEVDQIMVFHMGNAIVLGGAFHGCVVTDPLPLFEADSVKQTSLGV